MIQRVSVAWMVGLAVLAVGCGTRSQRPPVENEASPGTVTEHVTLHVKDMAKLLKLD
jgi:hypothetical protein